MNFEDRTIHSNNNFPNFIIKMEEVKTFGFKDFMMLLNPFLIGGICVFLWWHDLHQVIGWQGNGWLRKPLFSVYPIIFLIVVSFLLPMAVELKMPKEWVLFYIVLLFGTSCWAFFEAKDILHRLYAHGLHVGDQYLAAVSIWELMGVVVVFSIIFFIPMRHFHRTTDGMHIITIMVAVISVIPASIISIENLPLWDCKMNFMDAVKIGYPIFWITVFLGLLSEAAAKEWV